MGSMRDDPLADYSASDLQPIVALAAFSAITYEDAGELGRMQALSRVAGQVLGGGVSRRRDLRGCAQALSAWTAAGGTSSWLVPTCRSADRISSARWSGDANV